MPHCNGEKFKLGHYRDSCRQLPPYRDVRRPPADFLRHRTDDLACPPQSGYSRNRVPNLRLPL